MKSSIIFDNNRIQNIQGLTIDNLQQNKERCYRSKYTWISCKESIS
jgi:hypothetical protein